MFLNDSRLDVSIYNTGLRPENYGDRKMAGLFPARLIRSGGDEVIIISKIHSGLSDPPVFSSLQFFQGCRKASTFFL